MIEVSLKKNWKLYSHWRGKNILISDIFYRLLINSFDVWRKIKYHHSRFFWTQYVYDPVRKDNQEDRSCHFKTKTKSTCRMYYIKRASIKTMNLIQIFLCLLISSDGNIHIFSRLIWKLLHKSNSSNSNKQPKSLFEAEETLSFYTQKVNFIDPPILIEVISLFI